DARADRPDGAGAHDPAAGRRARRRRAVRAHRRCAGHWGRAARPRRLMPSELVHRELPSPNWDERALPVTMVVLHYTEMEREEALRRLTDPEAKVSAHYFIAEDGEVVRLVDEDK